MTEPGAPIDGAELAWQLRLLATPGLPPYRVRELLIRYHSGAEAFAALSAECGSDVASAAGSEHVRERVRRALAAIRHERITVLSMTDGRYPAKFTASDAVGAPPLLFARGRLELLEARSVGVVGCREATVYGLDIAEQIGGGVARAGGCVVSGLALGIDAAAHRAALDAGGDTVGILGCGIDVHYPRRNTALQDRIAEDGLLLSELLPGEPPRKFQFPERNRLIVALSEVVVVVEAGEKSGTLTTANHAAAQGTTVYGVPNAIHLPTMQGVLQLLREGAATYTGLQDLLLAAGLIGYGEAAPTAPDPPPAPAGTLHRQVWETLAAGPMHVDGIAVAAGLPVQGVLGLLLELELDGVVTQSAGHRYALVRR